MEIFMARQPMEARVAMGQIFTMTPAGTLITLAMFNISNGAWPFAGLMQSADGNFYGTTIQGGNGAGGTIFRFSFQPGSTANLMLIANPTLGGIITGGGIFNTGTVENITIQANNGWYLSNVTFNGPPDSETDGRINLNPAEQFQKMLQLYYLLIPGFDPTTITNFSPQILITSNSTVTAWFTSFALILTQQPTNQSVQIGSNTAFSVVANGQPTLNYQWRFNGQNLVGQTAASLSITSVQFANAGGYSVVVTNAYGSVTSAVAQLTVFTNLVFTQTNRAPKNTKSAANHSHRPNHFKVFTNGTFQSGIAMNPNKMTVVLTHGWNGSPSDWAAYTAQIIQQRIGVNAVNIVAWDWHGRRHPCY